MLMPKWSASRRYPCMRAFKATEITHSGGSSDPDMKAFAVMPRISPRTCVVTTVTPVTNDAMTRRKSSWLTPLSAGECDSEIDMPNHTKPGGAKQGMLPTPGPRPQAKHFHFESIRRQIFLL